MLLKATKIEPDFPVLNTRSRHQGPGGAFPIGTPILRRAALLFIAFLISSAGISAQYVTNDIKALRTGREIFLAGCAGCHGSDGKGAPDTTVGFEKPDTFPDFTRCDQTTAEVDVDYKAIVRGGGRARGFSRIMPSFGGVLSPDQIDLVVAYLRSLCRDKSWPRGELNFPRAIATEKAFPEDEVVITSAMNAQGAAGVENEFAYERRFGKRNQLEISVPFRFNEESNGHWLGGLGDVGVGVKHVFFSSLNTGSILGAQGEVIFPSGNQSRVFGTGVTVFETFASYGQFLPAKSYLQLQFGSDLPKDTMRAPRSIFGRAAIGRTFAGNAGFGRQWSPMTEFLFEHDFAAGAKTNFDILPEFQVTLNKRQHVRAAFGVRVPVNNTAGRPVQVVFYLLWDTADGRLQDGWK